MSRPFDGSDVTDFERALRDRAARPSHLSAPAARLRVLDRLPATDAGFPIWRLVPAAALVTFLFVAGWLGLRSGARIPLRSEAWATTVQAQSNVVVFQLDPTTTLYFVVDTKDPKNGGIS